MLTVRSPHSQASSGPLDFLHIHAPSLEGTRATWFPTFHLMLVGPHYSSKGTKVCPDLGVLHSHSLSLLSLHFYLPHGWGPSSPGGPISLSAAPNRHLSLSCLELSSLGALRDFSKLPSVLRHPLQPWRSHPEGPLGVPK